MDIVDSDEDSEVYLPVLPMDMDREEDDSEEDEMSEEQRVLTALSEQSMSSTVDLSDMDLTDDGAVLVAQWLQDKKMAIKVKTIKTFSSNNNHNNNHNDTTRHVAIEKLNLGSNNISDVGAVALAAALPPSLRFLELGRNNICTEGSKALAQALLRPDCTDTTTTEAAVALRVDYLSLQFNCVVQPEASLAWANTLASPYTMLQTLYLCTSFMGDMGIYLIANAMKQNKRLRKLWLCNNSVTSWGAAQLAEMLYTNNTLELLCLDANQIGTEGAISFASVLQDDRAVTVLEELYVRDNCIGPPGTRALCEAVQHNHKLVRVFSNCDSRACAEEEALQFMVQWSRLGLYRLLDRNPDTAIPAEFCPIILTRLLRTDSCNPMLDRVYHWIRNAPELFSAKQQQQQQQQR